jgi:hypothetical protein
MYFHGWTMDPSEGVEVIKDMNNAGFVSMAMTGMGGPNNYNSWRFAGTTESPTGPAGRVCNIDTEWECFEDCGACTDSCWWTTCKDSIG